MLDYEKTFEDILDGLKERYESEKHRVVTNKELAKELGIDISAFSRLKNGTRNLYPDEVIKLSEFFNVPTDVILGKKDFDEIDPINNNGLQKLMWLARKWIHDNAQSADTVYRVELLNKILSNHKMANLFFDALYTQMVDRPVVAKVGYEYSEKDKYDKQQLNRLLAKETFFMDIQDFWDDLYSRYEREREKFDNERASKFLNNFWESQRIAAEERKRIEEEELEIARIDAELERKEAEGEYAEICDTDNADLKEDK